MKRNTFLGLAAAAMLVSGPSASAAYWTGHSDVIYSIVENWIIKHLRVMTPSQEIESGRVVKEKPGRADTGQSMEKTNSVPDRSRADR